MTSKFVLKTSSAVNKIHVSSDMSKFAQNFLIVGFKIQKGFSYFSKNVLTSTLLSKPPTFPNPTHHPILT